ncbi:hypothetical protein BRAO375_1500003 [Bradyrhizobium sp. ORS 375]|nr:hypothetical protein BRAO375_1500003 [Bradyrhizobium sp. ORS 375]
MHFRNRAPKGAPLLTKRFNSRGGTAHWTIDTPRGVFMERVKSRRLCTPQNLATRSDLILRRPPEAVVSKDGDERAIRRHRQQGTSVPPRRS